MSQSDYHHNRELLQKLMEQVQITNLEQLSTVSRVSQWQLQRLLYGLAPQMTLQTIVKIATTLQVSLEELLGMFAPEVDLIPISSQKAEVEIEQLKQEYERLQQQMTQQQQRLQEEFELSVLRQLESLLTQYPTATAIVSKHPQLQASRFLPLFKPLDKLVKQWGLQTIALVGARVDYNPQEHELIEGTANPGDQVKVRYVGYKKGEQLLCRAKVSPIN